MAKQGKVKEARKLYKHAGDFYAITGERALLESPHEAEWAFSKAAECYKYGAYANEAEASRKRASEISSAMTPVPLTKKLELEMLEAKNVKRKT